MTKFNKRVLALAIAGAIMLPGVASAADLEFGTSQQITFAKDLIVNNGTTIYTPNDLQLIAEASAVETANLNTVAMGENVTVKVTLTNGALFDTTADAATLVDGFVVGGQLGGDSTAALGAGTNGVVIGTPYYSTSGQELNFTFTSPGAAAIGGDFVVTLNSFQITNLKGISDADGSVSAEITVQNSDGQQILASRERIAQFLWGITSTDYTVNGETAERIDVADCGDGNRLLFSPDGDVGSSCTMGADGEVFNAGGMTLDITEDTETGGGSSYINNYSAVAGAPAYNVTGTATWTFTLTGSDLAAFDDDNVYLSSDNCATGVDGGVLNSAGDTITFEVPASDTLVDNLAASTPTPANIDVCFIASGVGTGEEMIPQDLSLAWSIDYDLPTQRVNPPGDEHDILPLLLNGTTITFQNVNPGSNATAQSFLRLTNHNDFDCPITIDAKDDTGAYTEDDGNEVHYTLGAQASKQFNIDDLEAGSDAFDGMLGDGTGKWYVRVTAECANVVGSALNRNNEDGTVTNLTAERNNDQNLYGR